jgi:hypothetical protein
VLGGARVGGDVKHVDLVLRVASEQLPARVAEPHPCRGDAARTYEWGRRGVVGDAGETPVTWSDWQPSGANLATHRVRPRPLHNTDKQWSAIGATMNARV